MKEIFCTSCRQYKRQEAFAPEAKRSTCKSCYTVLLRNLNPNASAGIVLGGRPTGFTNASVKIARQRVAVKRLAKGRLPPSWEE